MAEAADDSIGHLEQILRNIHENVEGISQSLVSAVVELNRLREAETEEIPQEISMTIEENPKLSDVARRAIENLTWPLEPEELKNFLMEKAFGKPKPNVLPIARRYTGHIKELIEQLNSVKQANNQAHINYKEQRRLDINLNKRIDTLVSNIKKELEKEGAEGLSQMSIDNYVVPQNI